jgi:hypothetical protein
MEMGRFFLRFCTTAVAVLLLLVAASGAGQAPQKSKKKEKPLRKEVQNFDGGILFATDGGLSELTCFKLEGRASAPDFFDDFKRIDDGNGTEYQSSQKIVTEFPEELRVSFMMFDIPCRSRMLQPGPRIYLTQEMMKSLRFSFYWKRGIELRHIEIFKRDAAKAELIEPFNTESKEELPTRYRWFLQYTIPSAGVPLTDRLVLIIRTPDGHRAARVAARL